MGKRIIAVLLMLGLANIAAAENVREKQVISNTSDPVSGSKVPVPWETTVDVDDYEPPFLAEANLQGSASISTDLVDEQGNPLGTREIAFGNVGMVVVEAEGKYIKVDYNTNYAGGAVAIHTYNQDDEILNEPHNPNDKYYRYGHDWAMGVGDTNPDGTISPDYGAGLVLENDGSDINEGQVMKAAPLLWGVFDEVSEAHNYAVQGFSGEQYVDESYKDEGRTTDPMEDAFDLVDPYAQPRPIDMIGFRTLVWWGYGSDDGDLLSMFAGRDANYNREYEESEWEYNDLDLGQLEDNTVFVTVAGDFSGGVPAGYYGTRRIILEVFHR